MLAIIIAAVLTSGRSAGSFTAQGTFTLKSTAFENLSAGDACSGNEVAGYSDIKQYADISITDAKGDIAGAGQLGAGAMDADDPLTCDFPIIVPNVSGGSNFYKISVGNESRGSLTYSLADLRDNEFSMGLDDTTN